MDLNNNKCLNRATLLVLTAVLCACGGGGGGSSGLPSTLASGENGPPITAPLISPRQPGDVVLSWIAPTTRADNSALPFAQIEGYQICYTGSDGRIVLVPDDGSLIAAGQTEYMLRNLPADTYQFNIFTHDSDGLLSKPSDTVILSINQFATL